MNKKSIVVILVFLGVMLVACGGSSTGSTSETVNLASPTQNLPAQSDPVMVTSEALCPTCPYPKVELTDANGNPLPTAVVETPEALPTGTPHPDEIVPVGAEFIGQWELYFYWVPAPDEQLVILRADSLSLSPYGFNRTALGAAVDRNNRSVVNAIFVKVEEDPGNIVGSFYYDGRVEFFANNPPPLN